MIYVFKMPTHYRVLANGIFYRYKDKITEYPTKEKAEERVKKLHSLHTR